MPDSVRPLEGGVHNDLAGISRAFGAGTLETRHFCLQRVIIHLSIGVDSPFFQPGVLDFLERRIPAKNGEVSPRICAKLSANLHDVNAHDLGKGERLSTTSLCDQAARKGQGLDAKSFHHVAPCAGKGGKVSLMFKLPCIG